MKIEHLETHGWEAAFRGMRNPLQSWVKSDSDMWYIGSSDIWDTEGVKKHFEVGPDDLKLAKQLIKAGPSHRKFLRMITIQMDVTAPEKWWAEFDTYEFTVENSTSMTHKFGSRMLTKDDFCDDVFPSVIFMLNEYIAIWQNNKTEENWRLMIMNCPMGFLYRRTVTMNYEVFLSMYHQRKSHKLSEWREFCKVLRNDLPYMDQFIKVLEEKNGN